MIAGSEDRVADTAGIRRARLPNPSRFVPDVHIVPSPEPNVPR